MTISGSGIAALLAFAAVFIPANLAVQLLKRRVPGLRGRQQLAAAGYLTRYSVALEYYGLRGREIRARVDELRADLAEAAQRGDAAAALARLGPPRSLAASMAGEQLRPSWLRGILWVSVVFAVGIAAHILALEAFLGGFEPLASPGASGAWSIPGLALEATMGEHGRASSIGFSMSGLLLALPVAFLVGSRAWRLRTGRNA